MNRAQVPGTTLKDATNKFRDRFAQHLGVDANRKVEVYLDIAKAAQLRDPGYWLQLLFAAGVATLGLAQDSPAVIIGAMLISPLMGPILASGLSLGAGDLSLGVKAGINLLISCTVSILFSFFLVALLPFKAMTSEIAARTHPNSLDLVVALLSGGIGSIAICREARGVVTSIPGVAIAVALMPPLCVVGYGLGLAVSLDSTEGMLVARGGGLLFLTNLVAITFTAMVVFVLLRIDTPDVRIHVLRWRQTDEGSLRIQALLDQIRVPRSIRHRGGLSTRLVLILLPLLLISIPLTQSLGKLKMEYQNRREENRVRRAVTDLWRQRMERDRQGETRSYFDQLVLREEPGNQLEISLRVFTNAPYGDEEKRQFGEMVAARLGRPFDSVRITLIEAAMASADLSSRRRDDPSTMAPPPSISQQAASLQQALGSLLRAVRLPQGFVPIDFRLTTPVEEPSSPTLSMIYLANREMSIDAQELLRGELQNRLSYPTLQVEYEHLPTSLGSLPFARSQTKLLPPTMLLLDRLGRVLRNHFSLSAIIWLAEGERAEAAGTMERNQQILQYLQENYQIAPSRIQFRPGLLPDRRIEIRTGEGDGEPRSVTPPASMERGTVP
jgi:uncharacterized hydrophobic protein (TIGR00271 family)